MSTARPAVAGRQVRDMTATLTPSGSPRDGARPALFVISTHKVRDRAAGTPNAWLPYGTQHAWTPGTRRTLCGQWTSGWTVFWERPFSARPATACPACIEATLPEAARLRLDPRPPVPA
jgi:hypothetical protein